LGDHRGISQPSVSYQLKLLQEQIGAMLFVKAGRGIQLTEKGESFLKEAESILSQIDTLNRKYRTTESPETSVSLSLGGSYGSSASLLPSLMAIFSSRNPLVELSLRTASSPEIQDLVVNSEVELAVVTNPPPNLSLVMEPLREEKFVLFVAPKHALAKRGTVEPAEVLHFPFIVREGKKGSRRMEGLIVSRCKEFSKLRVSMRYDSPESVKAAVRSSTGVGILHHDIIKDDFRRGVFKSVRLRGLEFYSLSYIVYSKDRMISSCAEAFLSLLRTQRTRLLNKDLLLKNNLGHSNPVAGVLNGAIIPSMIGNFKSRLKNQYVD
jgi:DNA-binding transcriptional LysR family regulator